MDNFVTEIIPYGHENAITRAELATRLGESDRVIRAGINKSEELIINLQDGKGYFKPLPEEGNLVKAWIKLFESRVKDESRRLSLARGGRMKGYKVFKSDWTCREFQYEVGKTYEMKEGPVCCKRGFHFCRKLIDCFNYYRFDSENKVAEIEAMGAIDKRDSKFCTNKIKIIRELTWHEVLDLVNVGKDNTGNRNSGNRNSGNRNSGDWNITDFSTGCFNTKEEKIRLFNKRSNWTYRDWRYSSARDLMCDCPYTKTVWINEKYMTDSEKEENPTWERTGGYLKTIEVTDEDRQAWWDNLDDEEREEVMSLPNFDKEIFKKITGIEV